MGVGLEEVFEIYGVDEVGSDVEEELVGEAEEHCGGSGGGGLVLTDERYFGF